MSLRITRTIALESLPTFLTEQEVASYLRIDERKLRRLGYEKRGPRSKKLCGVHRYHRDDLVAWLRGLA